MVYKHEGMSFRKDESNNSSTNSVEDDQIRLAQLQIQFHGTRREDFQPIESYVKKLKSTANSLAEINSPISDSDMVLQLLAGLPNQYLPLKNTISSMRPLPNFEEASSMLYMQEDILLQDREKKFKADAGGAGAEQSSGLFTADTFFTVVDTVGIVVAAVGAVGTICAGVGALGTAVGAVSTVNATRMIVGSAITVVVGWKIWQRK
uniref:Putative ovule protein n=1 Tax=Solanum chacoense TaxID=4108 RepID=A0A0V0I9T9_SOLCH